jgi:hypothetical protein
MQQHLLSFLVAGAISAGAASPVLAATPGNDPTALAAIVDGAMTSNFAQERLADMTDLIGPRLSGSPGAAAAVEQVAEAMRKLGATVTLQPVKVPHWVRGLESAELVEYRGRPAGVTQRIVLTALGGSSATPAEGLTAQVVVVRSLDELAARAGEVKGRIVLFDLPFNQPMAQAGMAGFAYRSLSAVRAQGPARAAELGAAAALVRSIGGANYRLPHAGNSALADGKRIPAASVTAEDAMLIGRLAARGPVSMRLVLTPRILPDADSFNVIADWPGTDKADEVVIVSGHLDSWDLGTGANDDALGVVSAMGVIEILKKLDYRPRRTIRVVAWMNEENGARGAKAYLAEGKSVLPKHVAAIESDNGSGRPFGMRTSVAARDLALFAPLQRALQPIGANALRREDALATGDLSEMEKAGVPSFAPLLDLSDYFHYHHTAADTYDKVDPDNLRRHVAVMSATAWFLANLEGPLARWTDPAK